jgi:hypothetical protein
MPEQSNWLRKETKAKFYSRQREQSVGTSEQLRAWSVNINENGPLGLVMRIILYGTVVTMCTTCTGYFAQGVHL